MLPRNWDGNFMADIIVLLQCPPQILAPLVEIRKKEDNSPFGEVASSHTDKNEKNSSIN